MSESRPTGASCTQPALPQAPSLGDCLRHARADLHPWQVEAVRKAMSAWLHSWQHCGMTAESLVDRV